MHIINFSHPFTADHLAQLAEIIGDDPATYTVHPVPSQIDRATPILDAAQGLLDTVPWDAVNTQAGYLIIPPGLAPTAIALMGILITNPPRPGYCGWVNLRPIPDSIVPTFEVAEVVL